MPGKFKIKKKLLSLINSLLKCCLSCRYNVFLDKKKSQVFIFHRTDLYKFSDRINETGTRSMKENIRHVSFPENKKKHSDLNLAKLFGCQLVVILLNSLIYKCVCVYVCGVFSLQF